MWVVIDLIHKSQNPTVISHNAPFRTEMCTFLFWMEHCGIWSRCILGFVKLIHYTSMHLYWWVITSHYLTWMWLLNRAMVPILVQLICMRGRGPQGPSQYEDGDPGGGTPYVMGDTYVPRFWPPFFTLAGSSTIFLGCFFSSTNTKTIFWVQILAKFDLFGPKIPFSLDLFGSNFQWPAAHPQQFSDRVPPPRDGD